MDDGAEYRDRILEDAKHIVRELHSGCTDCQDYAKCKDVGACLAILELDEQERDKR